MEDSLKNQAYDYVENLERQFDAAIADIDTQMRAWYQRFADNNGGISWAEAQRLLTAGELKEFKWTVQEYIKAGEEHAISGAWAKELENASARVHISRLESLKIRLRQQAEVLTQATIQAAAEAAELSYTESYYHTAFEVQRGFGVGWTMQGVNASALEKVLSRPWTADNRTFTARCWTDKAKLVETVNQELTRMIATGEAPGRAIETISKRFNVSKQNASRVVMTEALHKKTALRSLVLSGTVLSAHLIRRCAKYAAIWTARFLKWANTAPDPRLRRSTHGAGVARHRILMMSLQAAAKPPEERTARPIKCLPI